MSYNMSFMFFNIRSINCNFDRFYDFLVSLHNKPKIIGISETWLYHKKTLTSSLPGYKFIHSKSCSKNGGAAFFVDNQIQFNVLSKYHSNLEKCEDLWLDVVLPNKSLNVGIIYRHPNHKFTEFEKRLCNIIQNLNQNNNKFIIGGDINIDYSKDTKSIINYKENLLSSGCSQEVMEPTRISYHHNSSSIIDHVYTNFSTSEVNTNVIIEDITDHFPVVVSLSKVKLPKLSKKTELKQDFKNFDQTIFLTDLKQKLSQIEFQKYDANKS